MSAPLIAFYAPMKPPTHAVPSGDREIARALLNLLPGAKLVSDLRLYEGKGDAARQEDLQRAANAEASHLIRDLSPNPPKVWVSYHNYYKAPDLLGPAVTRALRIPYVLIEATRAKKRLTGPWAHFATKAEAASDAANLIFYFTQQDKAALEDHRGPYQTLCHLPPFLPLDTLPAQASPPPDAAMLSVGMLRPGDKMASYRLIAQTLPLLTHDWTLDIAGDGEARGQVEALFAPFGRRVRFLGQLERPALDAAYAKARLLFWPGAGEAFGMVYLEAQARGVPVVAQDRAGVRDVLMPGEYPAVALGARGLARKIGDVLAGTPRPGDLRDFIQNHHLAPAARVTLETAMAEVLF